MENKVGSLIPKEIAWKAIKGELTLNELVELQGKYPEPDDYYDYDLIQGQIKRFINGEIKPKYLAYWANIYSWAITGSYEYDEIKAKVLFQIQDCLDGLSYINSEPNKRETKESARRFRQWLKEYDIQLKVFNEENNYTNNQFVKDNAYDD